MQEAELQKIIQELWENSQFHKTVKQTESIDIDEASSIASFVLVPDIPQVYLIMQLHILFINEMY